MPGVFGLKIYHIHFLYCFVIPMYYNIIILILAGACAAASTVVARIYYSKATSTAPPKAVELGHCVRFQVKNQYRSKFIHQKLFEFLFLHQN